MKAKIISVKPISNAEVSIDMELYDDALNLVFSGQRSLVNVGTNAVVIVSELKKSLKNILTSEAEKQASKFKDETQKLVGTEIDI
jgi:hypothetical protein